MDALRLAEEVSWRSIEPLPFPMIHMHPDGVAIFTMNLSVDVNQSLDVVVTRGNVLQRLERVSQSAGANFGLLSGREMLEVFTEELTIGSPSRLPANAARAYLSLKALRIRGR
jgi:hypothetical protein